MMLGDAIRGVCIGFWFMCVNDVGQPVAACVFHEQQLEGFALIL